MGVCSNKKVRSRYDANQVVDIILDKEERTDRLRGQTNRGNRPWSGKEHTSKYPIAVEEPGKSRLIDSIMGHPIRDCRRKQELVESQATQHPGKAGLLSD